MVFDAADFSNHEQVSYFADDETGLRAIVAIHDTSLGPSLGGTRMRAYETEQAALTDVLRLSSAMTAKAAAADLDLGGGKAVLIGDPETKDEAMLRSYGRAVENLAGRYITSVDVNTSVADMDIVARETPHVTATSNGLGDPSPITARGVLSGIRACVEYVYGRETVADTHVAVQGMGKVGLPLAEELAERGARVTATDVNEGILAVFCERYEAAQRVPPEEIYDVDCDVFAPCAMGGAINDETIPRLSCDVVAGSANNMLAEERRHATALHDRGILYAPDYVVNAGGLITVANEYFGGTREAAFDDAAAIGDRLLRMIERAEEQDMTVLAATEEYVADRIAGGERPTPPPTDD